MALHYLLVFVIKHALVAISDIKMVLEVAHDPEHFPVVELIYR